MRGSRRSVWRLPRPVQDGFAIETAGETDEGVTIFHAGTKVATEVSSNTERVLTDGGRVLTVTAMGDTLDEARRKAYANASRISFTGSFYRRDVALLSERD